MTTRKLKTTMMKRLALVSLSHHPSSPPLFDFSRPHHATTRDLDAISFTPLDFFNDADLSFPYLYLIRRKTSSKRSTPPRSSPLVPAVAPAASKSTTPPPRHSRRPDLRPAKTMPKTLAKTRSSPQRRTAATIDRFSCRVVDGCRCPFEGGAS